VGGHGDTGSADPPQVGDILRSPSERADPLESEEANVTDVSVMAESVTKLPSGSSEPPSPRQPPTVSDTTAAAFLRSTLLQTYMNNGVAFYFLRSRRKELQYFMSRKNITHVFGGT